MKRNSLFLSLSLSLSLCLHLQSVAIANNGNSVTLYSAAANTINTRTVHRSKKNMDIERFFCSFLPIDTFSSDQQTAAAAALSAFSLCIAHDSTNNTSLNKRKKCNSAEGRKSSFVLSIVRSTDSRYSGICLPGNVDSGKTYRQLSEQAKERKMERRRVDGGAGDGRRRWRAIMKNG